LVGVCCILLSFLCTVFTIGTAYSLIADHSSSTDPMNPQFLIAAGVSTIFGIVLMTCAMALIFPRWSKPDLYLRSTLAYCSTGPVFIGAVILLVLFATAIG
jgi:hypothetical protein